MNPETELVRRAADCIRQKTDFVPELVLTLGSGLGAFAEEVCVDCAIDYSEIDGFPVSSVEGHRGRLIFGTLGGRRLALMQGRVHLYEGYTPAEAVRPLRALRLLGAKTVFLTNAAGGVNAAFSPGDLMVIRDHVASFVQSPLRGENLAELGVRFPDMSAVYSPALSEKVRRAAEDCGIVLREGVYLQTAGPQFETPSEIRMYRTLGADAVGMSTAIEAIAARHAGMDVVGVSLISNLACGMTDTPLSHEEVQEAGRAAAKNFTALVKKAVSLF